MCTSQRPKRTCSETILVLCQVPTSLAKELLKTRMKRSSSLTCGQELRLWNRMAWVWVLALPLWTEWAWAGSLHCFMSRMEIISVIGLGLVDKIKWIYRHEVLLNEWHLLLTLPVSQPTKLLSAFYVCSVRSWQTNQMESLSSWSFCPSVRGWQAF